MFTPIAIIGRACLLPGAQTPEELWNILLERRTSIGPAPASRWRASRDRLLEAGICSSDAGGFVRDFSANTGLDPRFDTLVHWLVHVARNALNDAGIDKADERKRAGAIVGNLAYPTESLADLAQSLFLPEAEIHSRYGMNRFSAGFPVHLLCRTLGLNAGGYAIDAACASSLYAIKIASDWLSNGRADVMLAGAINRVDGLLIHAGFTALRALSPSGQSRPFHRDADGLIPAEGAAFLVLKRLADAEAAGDRIFGVIRGIGLSNDGRGSGLLTPSAAGQVRAMRAAYDQSGLRPGDISLIECHATGTTVGDAVEVQSTAEVFHGLRDVPIGSLKSNLGHLITVSGAAGIIKLLEAMRHGRRPPTLNATPATPALTDSPFRLVLEEEEWKIDEDAPRRAAISSFGFGGNNAHLLLEEYRPAPAVHSRHPRAASRQVAVVAMAARLADGMNTEDFEADLIAGRSRIRALEDGGSGAPAAEVRLPSSGLVFPPRDLERTLAQQNLLLEVALDAMESMDRVAGLPPVRTAAYIGMTCDAEGTRTILRAAMPDLLAPAGIGSVELSARESAMDAGFDAARVIGCMPNIPANRLNRQFDLGGPGFTVASEELSGVRALELAIDALLSNEIDAAVVGAVDLCVEPVHRSATAELPPDQRIPGDGACMLVLKRIQDSIRDGDAVRAIVELPDRAESFDDSIGNRVRECFGHVHAASGLLDVAAAVVAAHRHVEFIGQGPATPWLPASEARRIHIETSALGGQHVAVTITEAAGSVPPRSLAAHSPVFRPNISTYSANDVAGLLDAVNADAQPAGTNDERNFRLAIVSTQADLPGRLDQARSFLHSIAGQFQDVPTAGEGIFFSREPMRGELAFVFTGAAAAYPDMGRDLLLAFPQLVPSNSRAEWVYRQTAPNDYQRLCGSSLLCQVHAQFTQRVLGLTPDAAIGLSSGETNSLYALGAWQGMGDLLDEIEECGLYTSVLGGRADAIREAWKEAGIAGERWAVYWIPATIEELKPVLANEPAMHITIINSPADLVVAGEAEACRRVVARFAGRAMPLGEDFAAHCPELAPAASLWRRLHHRPTRQPDRIRFYSNAHGGAYVLTADSVADALTQQAIETVDFPRTIRQAWGDGVRIFVEHGPRSQCSRSIRRTLGDRPCVTVSLDLESRSSLVQATYAAAELWTAGVAVDLSMFQIATAVNERKTIRLPAHPPRPDVVVMAPAPELAPVRLDSMLPDTEGNSPEPVLAAAMAAHAQVSIAHQEHMQQMARIDLAYQETQLRILHSLAGGRTTAAPPRERSFSRHDLEIHASGNISKIFGTAFQDQDRFARQVRMPEVPLLLADRVISLTGEPGSMGLGSITTETDVVPGTWYLHYGRMPAGVTIEAGQADLMLISWLGVDKLNQGNRVYRLLGCDLCFSGGLPKVGETLRYNIRVDSHASHAGIRIFFFQYDCTSGTDHRLTVRNAQAGFFTDEELAGSEGVLWSPETGSHTASEKARLHRGPQVATCRSFDSEQVRAFSDGRPEDCFGAAFQYSRTHTRTPRTQNGRMQLLQRIPQFDPDGGPWKRGYLRAEWNVRPDDWFFKGHFKNDPCMPGTLMFEGCLQAMAFYLSALGLTLGHDGWRFQPVQDAFYSLRCRGQVLPSSRLLIYEVFVDEIVSEPIPTLYADVLCTVDGLKAFHCARLGLQLTPDWPLDETQLLPSRNTPFDEESLAACALGRPSNAFGREFARFDGPIKVPRLPGPPYHFMSRVVRTAGSTAVGATAEVEYDVPADAWYFAENAQPVMPVCVLTEVLLQPCGWLASFAGTWKAVQHDIFFRNLDGSGIIHGEVTPATGTVRTRVVLTSCSEVGAMSITAFQISCSAAGGLIFEGQAVFGHFPAQALQNQAGLPVSDDEQQWMKNEATAQIDLAAMYAAHRLGSGKLHVIDRVTGYWPKGGSSGLGVVRTEFDVDPGQWFFKAHFFGDPVQPGSLGMEAITQTLQIWMLASGQSGGMRRPRFEAIATGEPVKWTYRGQVLPHNRKVTILLEITDAANRLAKAAASLWVDGAKIYSIPNVSMRLVESAELPANVEELDPARDTWLRDHCPTYTIPVLPMMSSVDRLAAAAHAAAPGKHVVELRDVVLNGWIGFSSGARRLKTDTLKNEGSFSVTLSVWRDAPHIALSRYDAMATAVVRVAETYPGPPEPMLPLTGAVQIAIPYESGELFHGPDFQFVRKVWRSDSGSSFDLESAGRGVPKGYLNQGLFDGITHGIPNENLRCWSDRIAADQVGYPSRIPRFSLFADPPADGASHCEVRFAGFHGNDHRFPMFRAQLQSAGKVWAELELVYVLFPKGPLGNTTAQQRRAFLQQRQYVANMELGHFENEATFITTADLAETDWLPGTVDSAFNLTTTDRLHELAAKQHIARRTRVHPAEIALLPDSSGAVVPHYPLNRFLLKVERTNEKVRVEDGVQPALDCSRIRRFWEAVYGVAEWPVADLHMGLIERFVRRVELVDPASFEKLRGKPAVFLGNHQVAIESILFNVVISALAEAPIRVIAKIEHRQSWMGQLIDHTFAYPKLQGPRPILFFDRTDPAAMVEVLTEYRSNLKESASSLMVHVDGTRALSCRTPVSHVSPVFLDLALELDLPVVPVRFAGALPVQPIETRLEFPCGGGHLDIRIGRPIHPDELRSLNLIERSKTVVQSINALAPAEESAFGTGVFDLPVGDTLIRSLRSAGRRCTATESLLLALDGAAASWPADEYGQWLQKFQAWLETLDDVKRH